MSAIIGHEDFIFPNITFVRPLILPVHEHQSRKRYRLIKSNGYFMRMSFVESGQPIGVRIAIDQIIDLAFLRLGTGGGLRTDFAHDAVIKKDLTELIECHIDGRIELIALHVDEQAVAQLPCGRPLFQICCKIHRADHQPARTNPAFKDGSEYVNKFIEQIVASGEKMPTINVQDGDRSTCWSAEFIDGEASITFTLNRPVNLTGISYLPKQDNKTGRIKDYVIEVSADGKQWTEAARGQFAAGTRQQSVEFKKPVGGSALRVRVLSSQDGKRFASAAEIDIQTMD